MSHFVMHISLKCWPKKSSWRLGVPVECNPGHASWWRNKRAQSQEADVTGRALRCTRGWGDSVGNGRLARRKRGVCHLRSSWRKRLATASRPFLLPNAQQPAGKGKDDYHVLGDQNTRNHFAKIPSIFPIEISWVITSSHALPVFLMAASQACQIDRTRLGSPLPLGYCRWHTERALIAPVLIGGLPLLCSSYLTRSYKLRSQDSKWVHYCSALSACCVPNLLDKFASK